MTFNPRRDVSASIIESGGEVHGHAGAVEFVDDLLFHAAARHPGRPALVFEGRTTTYAELASDTRRFAAALRAAGVRPLERIGIFLDKREETVIAIMGTAAAGAVFVPINPALRASQVAHVVDDCSIQILITSRNRIADCEADLSRSRSLGKIILVEEEKLPADWSAITFETFRRFLESGGPERLDVTRNGSDEMAGILYTSGSTGDPKGVVLSHRNFVARAKCVSDYLELTADDRILNLPHYSFGFGLDQLFNAFYVGACSVLHNYVTPQGLMRVILEEAITGIAGVPTSLMALAALDWPLEVRETVRYIAAAGGRMPEITTRSLRCLAPEARIYLMYGQTETLRSTYLPPREVDRRPNSMGKAMSAARIYVVRADGTLCGPNEPGQLVQTGETVALGYWNDPDRTAQIFRPAPVTEPGQTEPAIAVWSGDMVSRDEDGFLYYIGRQDDLIKTSGYRVSPTEIEDVLYASGLVESAAAIGVKHDELGQVIVAFVTTRGNAPLDREALLSNCRRALPNYMLPYQIVQCDALPLNANGKVDRKRLSKDYFEQGNELAPARASLPERPGGMFGPVARLLEIFGIRKKSFSSVGEIFGSVFNLKAIDETQSFSSLGGDSLSYVDVSTGLEDYIGHIPDGWENMSIQELERLQKSASAKTTIAPDVLLRAAAIMGVVSLHNRYTSLAGGPSLLFELSGLSFARFAWAVDPAQVRRSIFGTMVKIVAPTMLLLLIFFLGDGLVHWGEIFFFDNLAEASSPPFWEGAWFVQVLFQIFLFMVLLTSIPGVTAFGERHRYAFGILFTAGAFLLHYSVAAYVHTPMLRYGNLPQYFLWQFALGWLVFASRNQIQRALTLLMLLGMLAALTRVRHLTGDSILDHHAPYWMVAGSILLLWLPPLPFPRSVAAPIVTIAKSTLFIYLFHWPFDVLAFQWFHINGGPLGIAIGLTGALGVWALYEGLMRALRSLRGPARQPADVFG